MGFKDFLRGSVGRPETATAPNDDSGDTRSCPQGGRHKAIKTENRTDGAGGTMTISKMCEKCNAWMGSGQTSGWDTMSAEDRKSFRESI